MSDVIVSPDNISVYTTAKDDACISQFARNTTTGMLTYVRSYRIDIMPVSYLELTESITISSDGRSLYATSGVNNIVAMYDRDLGSGNLTYIGMIEHGVNGVSELNAPKDVEVSENGNFVFVASKNSGGVSVFSRNTIEGPDFGKLTYLNLHGDMALNGINGIGVSHDNKNVYSVSPSTDALVVSSLSNLGKLNLMEIHEDGVNGVNGLNGAYAVTVNPNGKFVYVAGFVDDAVAVFNRDTSDGSLLFSEYQQVDGLNGVTDVAVSDDGENVYSVGYTDDALVVFISINSALPIQLYQFGAHQSGNRIKLDWSTMSELNNHYFTIERSVDTYNWTRIATVDGAGTSNKMNLYSAIDNNPIEGITYYRLRQTDFNGEHSISKIEVVHFEKTNTNAIAVYPNPATKGEMINFNFDGLSEDATIVIADASGKELIRSGFSDMENDSFNQMIMNNNLPTGMYLISALSETEVYSEKLIIR